MIVAWISTLMGIYSKIFSPVILIAPIISLILGSWGKLSYDISIWLAVLILPFNCFFLMRSLRINRRSPFVFVTFCLGICGCILASFANFQLIKVFLLLSWVAAISIVASLDYKFLKKNLFFALVLCCLVGVYFLGFTPYSYYRETSLFTHASVNSFFLIFTALLFAVSTQYERRVKAKILLLIVACFGLYLASKWNARTCLIMLTLYIFGVFWERLYFGKLIIPFYLNFPIALAAFILISVLSFTLFEAIGDPRFDIISSQMNLPWINLFFGGVINWPIDIGSDNPHNTFLFHHIAFGVFGVALTICQVYLIWQSSNLFQSISIFVGMQTESITFTPYSSIFMLSAIIYLQRANKKNA